MLQMLDNRKINKNNKKIYKIKINKDKDNKNRNKKLEFVLIQLKDKQIYKLKIINI